MLTSAKSQFTISIMVDQSCEALVPQRVFHFVKCVVLQLSIFQDDYLYPLSWLLQNWQRTHDNNLYFDVILFAALFGTWIFAWSKHGTQAGTIFFHFVVKYLTCYYPLDFTMDYLFYMYAIPRNINYVGVCIFWMAFVGHNSTAKILG